MAHGWEFTAYGFPIPTVLRSSAESIPQVVVWDDVVIGPRRWILSAELIEELHHLNSADRYRAWRREVEQKGIGEWVWLSRFDSPDSLPVLVRTDSPLIIEMVVERFRRDHCDLSIRAVPGDPARWLIRDQARNHYVGELALTWVNPHHWQEVTPL
jgi:hypothetical protein